jgi:hypothetical protein
MNKNVPLIMELKPHICIIRIQLPAVLDTGGLVPRPVAVNSYDLMQHLHAFTVLEESYLKSVLVNIKRN